MNTSNGQTIRLLGRRAARPFDSERLLRAVARIQGSRSFENEEEASAFYSQFRDRPVDSIQARVEPTLSEDAQELAFRAMETHRVGEAEVLARQALVMDRHCIDAQVVVAQTEARSAHELVLRLKSIIRRAESQLGVRRLSYFQGQLWGLLEARPYLRARLALAEAYEEAGEYSQAIPALENILKLNEPDNQGIRFHLLRCHLANDDLQAAGALLKGFKHEHSAFVAWATVLARVRAHSGKGMETAFANAKKVNPYFAEFLRGRRLPSRRPGFPRPGSPEEAAAAIRFFSRTWRQDRARMNRLLKQE
jgi:tetratricopeptide (TPR) repeat protein